MPAKPIEWMLTVHDPLEDDPDHVVAGVVGLTKDQSWSFYARVSAVSSELRVGHVELKPSAGEFDPPPARGITAALFRSVSVPEIILAVQRDLPNALALSEEWAKLRGIRLPAATRKRIARAIDRTEFASGPTGSQPHPDAFYRAVALAYLDLDAAGVRNIRRDLAARITDQTGRDTPYSEDAAKAWLGRCKDLGFLIFHGQGRRGATPGPNLDPSNN